MGKQIKDLSCKHAYYLHTLLNALIGSFSFLFHSLSLSLSPVARGCHNQLDASVEANTERLPVEAGLPCTGGDAQCISSGDRGQAIRWRGDDQEPGNRHDRV